MFARGWYAFRRHGIPLPVPSSDLFPTVLERLSKTLARRQAEREDAISRAVTPAYEGPEADGATQLVTRTRRFFGLVSDPAGRG